MFIKTIISFLRDKDYRDLLLTTVFILGIGTVVYHFVEGWRWLDSLYFSVITLTTIGYGDFSPQTDAGKIFTLIYIVVGLGIILAFINTIFKHFDYVRKSEKKKNAKG
ncbi:MAG: two pore domain potassium channel family protein [Bacteroidetes bacterium]|uniref:Two pore domain potassium channel family protein n=1 Tax=Phaeocystidibacter marisrubri TaxID=1577780 RepID=A0A6L3ZGV6_9FLAO|nr:two pore domain potassium channel family protein [Phaeocystidibacter marisrubri]TNE27958.1 MAG: two pore domain potassium channel family protein [Bacteroidota bacterium]